MQSSARLRNLSAVLTTIAIAACTGPTDQPTGPDLARGPGNVKSVTVSPSSATLQPGQTLQLGATVKPPNSGATVTWSSSNSGVAAVSSTGLVTAVAAGTSTITATAGSKSGSSAITVSPASAGVVFVGAGDIASCASTGDEATATLLDGISGDVFTLGDNVYENGTAAEFTNCYAPSWGRHLGRTHPSPGNHDYNTPGATGYYGYFGAAAGDPSTGYYSYDLGGWHLIVLNSNLSMAAGSAQEQWLRADLAAHQSAGCTLAYWHHPRFSSGSGHGNEPAAQPLWQALYDYNADLVLSGHDHDYERFASQTPAGAADPVRGIREFVVGTGGRSHYGLGTLQPNSQVFNGATFGVLKLTLSSGGYSWQFIPVAGSSFTDSGSATCH